ncbi:hypothetical protein K8R62_04440, partial [bacterium]|nr:hypothetical protein [bacterium]
MKFVGVLIVNLANFGAVSALSWIVKSVKFFYIGFAILAATVFGSVLYIGLLIHKLGYWPVWFLVIAAISVMAWIVWEYFFITISADPPSIGILTVWGERKFVYGIDTHDNRRIMTVKYGREGLKLCCPYFPFFVNYNKLNVVKRNKEFEITVWCKRQADPDKPGKSQMGAQMKVSGSYTWSPDLERLYQFLQTGEDKGVNQILPDVIEEETREVAQENYWE